MIKEDYVKVVHNGIAYYIRKIVMPHVPFENMTIIDNTNISLLRFSDFAVNPKTNECIKCWGSIEEVLDNYLNI